MRLLQSGRMIYNRVPVAQLRRGTCVLTPLPLRLPDASLLQHQYSAALFWADKAVALSGGMFYTHQQLQRSVPCLLFRACPCFWSCPSSFQPVPASDPNHAISFASRPLYLCCDIALQPVNAGGHGVMDAGFLPLLLLVLLTPRMLLLLAATAAGAMLMCCMRCAADAGMVEDVFWLAQTYFHTGQFSRASFLLKSRRLPSANLACRYLAAKCHMESKEWEAAMDILGENIPSTSDEMVDPTAGVTEYAPLPHIASSLALLRGLVLEALDNRAQAVEAYTAALHRNVMCFEVRTACCRPRTPAAPPTRCSLAPPPHSQCLPPPWRHRSLLAPPSTPRHVHSLCHTYSLPVLLVVA